MCMYIIYIYIYLFIYIDICILYIYIFIYLFIYMYVYYIYIYTYTYIYIYILIHIYIYNISHVVALLIFLLNRLSYQFAFRFVFVWFPFRCLFLLIWAPKQSWRGSPPSLGLLGLWPSSWTPQPSGQPGLASAYFTFIRVASFHSNQGSSRFISSWEASQAWHLPIWLFVKVVGGRIRTDFLDFLDFLAFLGFSWISWIFLDFLGFLWFSMSSLKPRVPFFASSWELLLRAPPTSQPARSANPICFPLR